MAAVFLDASALVKRHVNETGSKWVRSLTFLKAPAPLFISQITTSGASSFERAKLFDDPLSRSKTTGGP